MGMMMLAEIRKEADDSSGESGADTTASSTKKRKPTKATSKNKKENRESRTKKKDGHGRTKKAGVHDQAPFEKAYSDDGLTEAQSIFCQDLNESIKDGNGEDLVQQVLKLNMAEKPAFLVCIDGKNPSLVALHGPERFAGSLKNRTNWIVELSCFGAKAKEAPRPSCWSSIRNG